MKRHKTAAIDHRDLLYSALREKFHYFFIGIFVLLFILIGIYSFAQRGVVPQPSKGTVTKQEVKLETIDANQLQKAMEAKPVISQNQVQKNTNNSAYTVQDGDNLWQIAEQQLGSGDLAYQIAQLNNISDPNIISAGQKLLMPKLQAAATKPAETTMQAIQQQAVVQSDNSISPQTKGEITDTAASTQRVVSPTATYTIKDGDSLWNIAQQQYGDPYAWVKIAQANNLDNPDLIYSGNTLNIPRS